MTLVERGERLLANLVEELARDPQQRHTRATDDELRLAAGAVRSVLDGLRRGAPPTSDGSLARMAVDSWSLTAELTNQLVEFDRACRQDVRRGQ